MRMMSLIQAATVAAALVLLTALSAAAKGEAYEENEIVQQVSDFFGVTSEEAAKVVERIFKDHGKPNAYIKGEEASGAIGVGLRYGKGQIYRKGYDAVTIHWRGPSIGFDVGGDASKCFTLVYNLRGVGQMYQRFPGVEGSYYFIAGIGVNYQQSGRIILAPMRTGLGLRAGVNAGYLLYSKTSDWVPF